MLLTPYSAEAQKNHAPLPGDNLEGGEGRYDIRPGKLGEMRL